MTARVALIGLPLRRPHSAVMHNAAFAAAAIDARYELMPLEPGELDGFFARVRAGGEWLGFQVTAPYKQEAAARCDTVEESAARIGAVNSVLREADGRLAGFNTDAPGFIRAVGEDLGVVLEGATVAVAGAGGAARAVAVALLDNGAGHVIVASRRSEQARSLVESLGEARLTAVALGPVFDQVLEATDLAVNATTVGMTSPGMAFDPRRLRSSAAVFDLVYVPAETPLLATAREAGVRAANGAGMLVAQAAIAFERWTGREGAEGVMREALEPLLAGPAQP